MRKVGKKLIVLTLALTMLAGSVVSTKAASNSKLKHFSMQSYETMKSIKISWKSVKGASYYNVYRKDATKLYERYNNYKPIKDKDLSKKGYKKVAKVAKKSYTDKKVKSGKIYIYYVNACSKSGKVVATTYYRGTYMFTMRGIGAPELYNDGDGENHYNTGECLYFYANKGQVGAVPDGFQVYRKAAGEKKYTRLKLKLENKKYGLPSADIKDDTVKTGVDYTYKMRSYIKVGKKVYYSKFSKLFRVKAINFVGRYDVKTLTAASEDAKQIVISIKSNKLNGVTTVNKNGIMSSDDNDEYDCCNIAIDSYSTDNKTWKTFSDKGYKLEAGKKVYLKINLINFEGKEGQPIVFTGKEALSSLLSYKNCFNNDTEGYIDLEREMASMYYDWD